MPALWLLIALAASSTAAATTISAAQAHEQAVAGAGLRADGETPLVVEGVFYLDRVATALADAGSRETLVFRNVRFDGGIRAEGNQIPLAVRFEQCEALFINMKGVHWLQSLEIVERCDMGRVLFERGSFKGPLTINDSNLEAAYFKKVDFEGSVEVLQSEMVESSFSGSNFLKSAAFDGSVFEETAKFYATEFERDVSFVEVKANGSILFQRVEFKGNAEFTECRFEEADFGRDKTTIFGGLADFRRCQFTKASFDATAFEGRSIFAKAHFGPGGVSFEDAHFANKDSSFEGVTIEGPLTLGVASAGVLRLHWDEISRPLLQSDPEGPVLEALRTRLRELGREEDAREVRYWLAHRERLEILESDEVSFFRKALIQATYLVWGYPTAYGTRPWLYVSILMILSIFSIFGTRYVRRRASPTSRDAVFISYRRTMNASEARLIHEELERQGFRTFMDVDDVGLGSFPAQLAEAVSEAKVMFVIMGPGWAEIADERGKRRLENPNDWVRREICLAIDNGAMLVPVLVREARMPTLENLPAAIHPLIDYQAVSLRSDAWKRDFARLVDLLTRDAAAPARRAA